MEEFEAEVEACAPVKTKKGKGGNSRGSHLEESISRHRQHVARLEQILRLLDNDELTVRCLAALSGSRLAQAAGGAA